MTYNFNISNLYLTCTNQRRAIVSDSVNLHTAKFTFDNPDVWDGASKTATFTNSKTKVSVAQLLINDTCVIPWEVLEATQEGGNLIVSVTGIFGAETFTTRMNNQLFIELSGVRLNPSDPTESVYDQIMQALASKGDNLEYENNLLSLLSGSQVLSSVTITGGGGGGGDMYKIFYDPTNVNSDAFNMDNMKNGLTYVRTQNDFSDTDKTKLDGLVNYSLPTMSTTVKGGAKINGTTVTLDADDKLTLNLTTDNVTPTLDKRYVPAVPTVEPSEKYLNGNGEFVTINVGASGYVSNLYLSTVNSTIVPAYDTLNYIPDASESEPSIAITSAMGEVLVGTYLGLGELDTEIIQSGLWKSSFTAKVSSTQGVTTARGEFFVRHANGTETTLFSKISDELEDTNYVRYATEETRPAYTVAMTDIIGFRLYAQTTRTTSTTITFIVGDGRGAYFNIPLQLRHNQLRDKNEEDAYQHITLTQKNELHTHANKSTLDLVSGTNTGDETNSTIITKIGYTPENSANKNQSLGYCGLDSGGKVPSSALPTTLLQYIGVWNASTNTPTLTSPDITKISNVYTVSVAGTQFGISFKVGDWLIYNASGVPEKSDNSDDVTSVNGKTGVVVLTTSDIADSLDKRYVTDTQKTVLTNTSGTNSGNETTTTIGTLINGATAKTTPIDADMVGLMDSASSNVLKKLSWANFKDVMKTFLDTLYLPITDYILDSTSTGTVTKELVSANTIKISTVLTSLTLTLPSSNTWHDNYSIEFSTASLTLPSGVIWDGGTAPTLSATKWYILTIFDGVALISQGATK